MNANPHLQRTTAERSIIDRIRLLATAALVLAASIANATTIINGGFETGDLTGWTLIEPNPSTFPNLPNNANVYGSGMVAPGGWPFFTSAPSEGSYAFLNRFDGSGNMRLYQPILVTADAPIIEFDYRAAWAIGISVPATQDRTFVVNLRTGPPESRVDHPTLILTAQHGAFIPGVCNLAGCSAPPGTPGFVPDTGLLTGSVDMTPFIGDTTAALVFQWNIPQSFYGPGFFQLDNVRAVAAVPEPGAYAMLLAGLGLLGFAALRRKQSAA
jgi:hypothetical protein